MKIYISLDMEGIAGSFDWEQETKSKADVKSCIYEQMEWVLQGIVESSINKKISEIVIADSHAMGDNLSYDFTSLDDRIYIISGYPRHQYMMPGFNNTYDIVFFIGYHAGVGALNGAMDHTYSSRRVHKIWINDKAMNESFINAAYAGYCSVPVGLIVGDETLHSELNTDDGMPWVEYVSTKEALGKFSAKLKPKNIVKNETIHAVKRCLNQDIEKIPIYTFQYPVTLKIEFATTAMADVASLMPYTNRIDGRTIEFIHMDYKTVFDALMALVTLASSVNA